MKKTMKTITLLSGGAAILCAAADQVCSGGLWVTLTITFAAIFYHFAMRLAVGAVYDGILHNHVDYHKKWFQPHPWEAKLYEKFGVKKWKKHLPIYEPDTFDVEKHTLEELAQAMCQSELVHETNAALSFLPLLAVPYVGAFFVFFITSLLAAIFDLLFVMIQRYNRPRIVKLIERQKRS